MADLPGGKGRRKRLIFPRERDADVLNLHWKEGTSGMLDLSWNNMSLNVLAVLWGRGGGGGGKGR